MMKKLYRDRWDKKIGGVCGGLGRLLGIDPTILRLLLVIICIFTGILPLLIAYIIAFLFIPQGPATYIQFKCKRLYRSVRNRKIAGICGGIAQITPLHPTLVRLLVLLLLLLTGVIPVLVIYLIGIAIIPQQPKYPFRAHRN